MERPNEHDYFEFRGNQRIVDYGSCDNYIEAQDEYIDFLIDKINKLEKQINDSKK